MNRMCMTTINSLQLINAFQLVQYGPRERAKIARSKETRRPPFVPTREDKRQGRPPPRCPPHRLVSGVLTFRASLRLYFERHILKPLFRLMGAGVEIKTRRLSATGSDGAGGVNVHRPSAAAAAATAVVFVVVVGSLRRRYDHPSHRDLRIPRRRRSTAR
jgi:hypothetical protein